MKIGDLVFIHSDDCPIQTLVVTDVLDKAQTVQVSFVSPSAHVLNKLKKQFIAYTPVMYIGLGWLTVIEGSNYVDRLKANS